MRDATIIPSDADVMLLPDSPPSYGPGMNHAFRRVFSTAQMTDSNLVSNTHSFEFKTDTSTMFRPRDSYFEVKFSVQVKTKVGIPVYQPAFPTRTIAANAIAAGNPGYLGTDLDYYQWVAYLTTKLEAWKAKPELRFGANGEEPLDKAAWSAAGVIQNQGMANTLEWLASLEWLGALHPGRTMYTAQAAANPAPILTEEDKVIDIYSSPLSMNRVKGSHDGRTIQSFPVGLSNPSNIGGCSLDDEKMFTASGQYLRRVPNKNYLTGNTAVAVAPAAGNPIPAQTISTEIKGKKALGTLRAAIIAGAASVSQVALVDLTVVAYLSFVSVSATAAAYSTDLPKLFEPDPIECAWDREQQIGENFQWTPLPMDAITRQFKYNIGGTDIVDYNLELAQRAALRVRSSKSNVWRSSVGSRSHVMSFDPEDLKRNIIEPAGHHSLQYPRCLVNNSDSNVYAYYGNAENDGEIKDRSTKTFAWQPPCSLFDINHGIPGAYHKFTLNFMDKWQERIYTNLARTQRGLDIDFEVKFVDMVFVAALTQTSSTFDTVQYTLSFEENHLQMIPLGNTNIGMNQLRFTVPANTIGLYFFMQDTYHYSRRPSYLLASAKRPATQFTEPGTFWQGVNRFQVTYGGRSYPELEYDCPAEQQDIKWIQTFSDLGMLGAIGGCETVDMWKDSGSFIYFRTIRDATENSTDVLVRMRLSKNLSADVMLFCCALYPKSFIIQGLDGRVVHTDQLSSFGVKDPTRSGPNTQAMLGSGQSRWRF